MKFSTAFGRTSQRERKYPFLVVLDFFLEWMLRGAVVAGALVIGGWLLWLTSPAWCVRVTEGAMQILR